MRNSKNKCYIIGSGIAGIAGAIRLAVKGFEVSIFEKNNYPGGKLTAFEKDGFHFDAGPSLFVEPENIEEIFSFAGEKIEEFLTYSPINISCKYFFDDGIIINGYTNKEKFANELEENLGENRDHLKKYLNNSCRLYSNTANIFLNNSLHKINTFLKPSFLKAIKTIKLNYILSTLDKFNNNSFTDKHTVQIFNRFATYSGSNPYKAPAMLSVIPHLEHNQGVYYPKGGMISITNALYKLALKKGVRFNFNSTVKSIIITNNEAKGIVVNGENLMCDFIISNNDSYFTYKKLLHNEEAAANILKQERSSSAIIFYWGINKEFPQLELHNILFSKDYKREFEHLFKLKKIYDDPTVYINITSKCEPSAHAPKNKENWFVMVNAPSISDAEDFNQIIDYSRKIIIKKIKEILQIDITKFIETEKVLHPKLIESNTGSFMGSLYGTSSNSIKAAFLRHSNFSKKIKRLYFAGGSVHPGGGIPLCLKSAKIASAIIEEDSKKWSKHA